MPHYKDLQNNLHWLDSADHENLLPDGCTKISDAEADAIRKSNAVTPTYAELRVSEYPPISDYIDGVVKGDQTQIQAYIDACLAVKAKYPNPV